MIIVRPVEEKIPLESHSRVKARYDREAITVRSRLDEINSKNHQGMRGIGAATELFQRMGQVWMSALDDEDPEMVSDFLSSILPEKMVVEGDRVRTPFGSLAKALCRLESTTSSGVDESRWYL